MAAALRLETFVGCGEESAEGGAGRTGGMSAGKVSGTVTGGTFSGMFIGVTGAVDGGGDAGGGGDVEDPDDVGHGAAGGQASSLNSFFQLSRHDVSGFADVTMSEVEA